MATFESQLLDRDVERAEIETAWRRARKGTPQLAVVWGRRRVGKTFLLASLARSRRSVFFGATEQSEGVELGRFAEALREGLGDRAKDLVGGAFGSWEAALRAVAALARDEPLMVVLDEVPYLARSTPGFASIVQFVWDHIAPGTRLLLVLTGSAVSVIEEMLGADGPLRGRPTLSRRIDPLDPVAARAFLPGMTSAAFFEAYAACGGYPLHLRAWEPRASFAANITRLALSPGGLLLADAASLLSEELADAPGYARILAAVGRGRTRFGEIANDAGQRVEFAIDVLVRAGLLRRALPVGAPKGARPNYEIADPYLAFWFSCLYARQTEIDSGQSAAVLERITPQWQRHVGWVFEEAARSHAARLVARGELPRGLVIGRWWATRGQQAEVDVLGLQGARTALIGEARWQAGALGLRDVGRLQAMLAIVPDAIDRPVIALWGRTGIASEARRAGAVGWSLREMLAE